jgi:serine protease Do
MFKRFIIPGLVIVAFAAPSYAQRKGPSLPDPILSKTSFKALFKPVVEKATRSTVRIQVDGKDAALGTVVSEDGYIVTKASEIKAGRISVKTHDGRDFDGKVTVTSEMFDLAVVKVEGTGLTPITWSASTEAPVGNWLAVANISPEPAAVGVVGAGPRAGPQPYGPQRIPTEKSGFLGVQLDQDANGATIGSVTPDSAAAKAGILAKDTIIRVDNQEINNQETLINTLLGYKAGDTVTIILMRDGKQMEVKAVLGKRTPDLIPKKGSGGNRGDFQNSMGSALSERRTGFPRFFQTDAVVKPSDCGAPVVDLDGHVLGLMIARAGRTESHVLPGETVRELLPVLLAAKADATPEKRVLSAREALKKAEEAKASSEVIAEGKRILNAAVAEEKWWKDHPLEKAPTPRMVTIESGPAPRAVK